MKKKSVWAVRGMSFFITLLIIFLGLCGVWITYRVESQMQADPIVILTITPHNDIPDRYYVSVLSHTFDVDLSTFTHTMDKAKPFIPASVKLFSQAVDATMEYGAEALNRLR